MESWRITLNRKKVYQAFFEDFDEACATRGNQALIELGFHGEGTTEGELWDYLGNVQSQQASSEAPEFKELTSTIYDGFTNGLGR